MRTFFASRGSSRHKRAASLPGVPIAGTLWALHRDPLDLMTRASRVGEIARMRFGRLVVHLVHRPEHVKHILVDACDNYGKQTKGFATMRLALGEGLITSEGQYWKRQRYMIQPAFHQKQLERYFDKMIDAALTMLDRWDGAASDREPVDLGSEMTTVTLRIIGECLCSRDLSKVSDPMGSCLAEIIRHLMNRIKHPWLPGLKVPTPGNLRFNRALRRFDECARLLIYERRSEPGRHEDILDVMLDATDPTTQDKMTERELRDQLITLLSAGHETSANALIWALYLVCSHPDVEVRLRKESAEVLGGHQPQFKDLQHLRYAEAVISEAMRLYPPIWIMGRSTKQDDNVGGYQLPGGSKVFVSPYVTQRHEGIWRDADMFKPERFTNGEAETLPRFSYFPFGGGPRICIGGAFAMMETKLLMTAILQRFRLSLLPGTVPRPEPSISLRPKTSIPVTLERVS